ncbi:MAG: hypothetical protein IT440_11885 [Phycisphaeraceae bacterium]|nr:hypothetical protein [Phycisphaeraceae bacterium]
MEIKTITVNKTQDRPEGVKLDVVVPQSPLETDLICYLLTGFLRQAQTAGRVKLDLPESFQIRYQSEGSYLVSTAPGSAHGTPYYAPPRPLAVVAVQRFGKRFDIAYANVSQSAFAARKGSAEPVEESTGATSDAPEAAEEQPAENV